MLCMQANLLASIVDRIVGLAPRGDAYAEVIGGNRLQLTYHDNLLQLYVSDGVIGARARMQLDSGGENWTAVVRAGLFRDIIVRLQGSQQISIGVRGEELNIETQGYSARLPLLADEPFALREIKSGSIITVDGQVLRNMLRRVQHAALKDATRHYLQGVYLTGARRVVKNMRRIYTDDTPYDVLCAVATDGHRMAIAEYERKCDWTAIIIPLDTVTRLASALKDVDVVELRSDGAGLAVSWQAECDIHIVSRAVEGTYPQWQSIIAARMEKKVLVDAVALRDAVQRVMPVLEKTNDGIVLEFQEDGTVSVMSAEASHGFARAELPLFARGVPSLRVGLGAKYLLDALRDAEEQVEIYISSAAEPVMFIYGSDLRVVMPRRI